MNKIYEDLYDITSHNIQSTGNQLTMKRDTFLYKQRSQEGVFDISLCGECDNDSFLQIAYLGMLGRMPDLGAVSKWTKKISLEPTVFRSQLLECLVESEEFGGRDVEIVNNIYNMYLLRKSKKVGILRYRMRTIKKRFYRLMKKGYMNLPEKNRRIIKKILKK